METEVQRFYGNRLRVRICGLCVYQEKMILINHGGVTASNFWAPPGGGLNFGEHAHDCIIREFKEEAGIQIKIDKFLFACEFIKQPLHAIELFFNVTPLTTKLTTGNDPETGAPSIISKAAFLGWDDILTIPKDELHGIFQYTDHPSKVVDLRGYFQL